MGQFLRVNGDYNIKCTEGSRVTFDTGVGVGEVRITGDLIVEGDTTTVRAESLNINDNIITVNAGETGAGVTLRYSGIHVDRGTLDPAAFFYDEVADAWIFAQGGPAVEPEDPPTPFNYNQSRIRLKEILTDSFTDDGDLTLIGTGTGVVKVFGTVNYEDQVTADDDIPNKKYVDDSILNNPTFQIRAPNEDTRIIIADIDVVPNIADTPGSLAYHLAQTAYATDGVSAISMIVDGQLTAQFYQDKVLIGRPGVFGLEIDGADYEIRTTDGISDQNIFVKTVGTGYLQTNNAIQLDRVTEVTPGGVGGYVSGSTLIYAKAPSIGQSGVWFRNDLAEETKRDGELISKNKALVFSMLF